VHRALSAALLIAAAWQLIAALWRARGATWPLARLGLITAQVLLGIVTLAVGIAPALSIAHQVGAVVLLAASLAVLLSGGGIQAIAPIGRGAHEDVRWRAA